jgi:hypothetical protein
MHIPILVVLATVSLTSAWQINFYEHDNYNRDKKGMIRSFAGPGKPGWRCFNVNNINGKISSMDWWPGPNGECSLYFHDLPGCPDGDDVPESSIKMVLNERTRWPHMRRNWAYTDKSMKNDISSFMPYCVKSPDTTEKKKTTGKKKKTTGKRSAWPFGQGSRQRRR